MLYTRKRAPLLFIHVYSKTKQEQHACAAHSTQKHRHTHTHTTRGKEIKRTHTACAACGGSQPLYPHNTHIIIYGLHTHTRVHVQAQMRARARSNSASGLFSVHARAKGGTSATSAAFIHESIRVCLCVYLVRFVLHART